MDTSVHIYIDDDPGFRAWRDENDDGYVVNAPRPLSSNDLMLHHANCGHMRHRNEGQGEHTMTGSFAKACSTSKQALDRWLAWSLGSDAELAVCQHCRPE